MKISNVLSFGLAGLASSAILFSTLNAATLEERVAQLEKDMEDVNDRVDENEVKAALSKVRFSLEFNASYSNIYSRGRYPTATTAAAPGVDSNFPNLWTMALYLNMNADINKYTKFTGRLSMTKAFGDLTWSSGGAINSGSTGGIGALDAGRAVGGGPTLYVERAYVDIYAGEHFAFTIGRLPTTDGPGANLRNGSVRMATYPALMVNALGDGVVLTYKPFKERNKFMASSAFRFGYGHIYQPLGVDATGAGNIWGNKGAANTQLAYVGWEMPFLPSSAGSSLLMLNYVGIFNYTLPGNSALGQLIGNTDRNIGHVHYANLHLEHSGNLASNFMLNWFLSASLYKGGNPETIPLNGGNARVLNTNTAYAVHAGLRFDFLDIIKYKSGGSNSLKIGYEFFYGSKDWYALSRVNINDPLNIRTTRGMAHDVYFIYQIDMFQFLRLSYTMRHDDYTAVSAPIISNAMQIGVAADRTIHNAALSYTLRY